MGEVESFERSPTMAARQGGSGAPTPITLLRAGTRVFGRSLSAKVGRDRAILSPRALCRHHPAAWPRPFFGELVGAAPDLCEAQSKSAPFELVALCPP